MEQGRAELREVVAQLDVADARLKKTLKKLRSTVVEAKLRPDGEERSLLDFVDEGGLETLKAGIQGDFTEAEQEFAEIGQSNFNFYGEVDAVRKQLQYGVEWSSLVDGEKTTRASGGKGLQAPISDILHEMEDHAREMAVNLESLVSHFDLCVTAIKHTEGGGDAALKIAGDLPEGVDIGQDAGSAPLEPMSDAQRVEMMRVLEEDAGQVDDVVMEIRDHSGEIEALYERVEAHTTQFEKEHAYTIAAFKLLEEIGRKLPRHIMQSKGFLVHWAEEKALIEERLEELGGLREFYDTFLTGYDNLLIEIGRRKAHELKMEKIALEAKARLEKLYDDDLEARETFKTEFGDFLPGDIWPGLTAGPLQFDVSPIDIHAVRVPDISKSVIHAAIKRVHGDK